LTAGSYVLLSQNQLGRSFELKTGLMKQCPISVQYLIPLKLGMKQGLEGQRRAQRQGDFTDNSKAIQKSPYKIGLCHEA
jgi:hypothetical protein